MATSSTSAYSSSFLRSSPATVLLLVTSTYILWWLIQRRIAIQRRRQGASLPPGPKPVPLVGNVLDLTPKELWLPAARWAKQYGEVVYLHIFGIGLVFLNSAEAASELLDKRGAIYSDKPALVMAGELCGCKNMVAFTSYGAQSKRQRRLLHKALGAPTIPNYHPLLLTETRAFLRRLIVSPAAYTRHIRRYAGGLTLSVIYGYEVVRDGPVADDATTAADCLAATVTLSSKAASSSGTSGGSAVPDIMKGMGPDMSPEVDDMLALAEECVGILANKIASGGGIWAVDVFPSLQRLPAWLPGMGWKTDSAKWKKRMEEFVDRPYEYVKMSMKSGNYKASFCSALLADTSMHGSDREQFEFDLKWSANSMYSASLDTTITTVANFILAMMLNPEVMRRAQTEIDNVIGSDRLPNFDDRDHLPYVECVFKECLRWGVPVPLNLPHRLMQDDVYKGMFIPKGSLVFGNIWAMMRDENVYANPNAFMPERFLVPATRDEERRRDPKNFVFGFGRRLCPGENLVDSSIWLLTASMIATLDISKAVDEHGNVIEPVVDFSNAIFRTPDQFRCDMRPRGPKAMSLIQGADSPF